MSYLDRLQAKAAKLPEQEPLKGAKGGFDPFTGSATGQFRGLPPICAAGLARLSGMATPPITQPKVWPAIVADALRLASSGAAAEALRLGWSPLQLWGCSPEPGGNVVLEGLAVRLMGRKPLIFATHAIMETAASTHSVFTPRDMRGAVFLWELGRG